MNSATHLIRNLGIAAHIDAGKTTATERILFYAGETHKMGDVHDGNTVTDHMKLEKERGITITAAAISATWATHRGARAGQAHTLNLIDTPGHIDFTAEVERSLRVLDGVVVLFSAVDGVQPQSETVWRQASKYHVPRLIFINKMDRPGADFARVVEQIRARLGANSHPLYLPVGQEDAFAGVIDVVHQQFTRFGHDAADPRGLHPAWESIPAEHADAAARAHTELIERLADVDPTLADLYLDNRPITPADLQAAIRRATIARAFFGIIPGSAFKEKGVQRLLDSVVDYLPSPLDLTPRALDDAGEPQPLRVDAAAPTLALAFKLSSTPNGQLVFVRVYQGTLTPGQSLYNPRTRRHERITRLVRLRAGAQENIPAAHAGDICAVLGLRDAVTGDTLSADLDLFLERPTFPEPVVSLAIEPATREDQERLGLALARLIAEDPTLRSHTDPETGQVILSGMGELHLEIIRARMLDEFRVETTAGRPRIAFRETITRTARAEGEFKRQNGGHGQYADVVVVLEPNPGRGNEVVNEIAGGAIPKQFIKPTLAGLEDALKDGVLDGSIVTDVRVRVVDGAFHATDSSEIAFRTAARMAFKAAMREAGPVLLEPIMAVEVTTPAEYQGDLIGDLGRRRGEIRDVATDGALCTITADVPLAALFGYAMDIRSLSKGRADYSMTPSRYAIAPAGAVPAGSALAS
ncbi:MAG: elongation factor G [Verrucomicrobia bacterium]|nr:elongation factor G [Verrucomicrobiota bacterium]